MWLRKTSDVFLSAQNYMGGKAGSWKNRNYNTYEKIPKNKNYMALYGWQAGSGQYRLISRPPLGIICNHRPATFVCFIPAPQTTITQCTMLFILCSFVLVVALEHSRVLAIFCSTVFPSDNPCIESKQSTLNTRMVWNENCATRNREYSRVLECHH